MRYVTDHFMYAAGNDFRNTIRTGIEMSEPVDEALLRQAVDRLPLRFPYFAVRLIKEGESYFYESNEAPYVISKDGKAVKLGSAESNEHLVAFAYSGRYLYIDSSHFLMDGGGKFPFLKMLLYEYLSRKYPEAEFDIADIPQPGDEIRPEEMTDDPYPEEEIPTDFPEMKSEPEEIFMLRDQPQGYEHAGGWTAFRFKVKQKEMMQYVSSADGSPATFVSSLIYRAISGLNPENRLPLVCGMQHQFRKALGNPFSHSSHVRIVPISYPDKMRERDLGTINTIGRGVLLLRASDAEDSHSINEYLRNKERLQKLTLSQKQKMVRWIVRSAIGKNTFEVSYTGRVRWSGLDRYIRCFTPYIDLTLSGGISAEIFALGEYFDINIMQRNNDPRYVDNVLAQLKELGIHSEAEAPEPFEICGFQTPLT